jgi:hypothetical protein
MALLVGSVLPNFLKVTLHTTANHRIIHPALHIFCFAVLAALLGASVRSANRLIVLFPAAAFGILLELLEHLVSRQMIETKDIKLDAGGAILGALFVTLACRSSGPPD